MTNAINNIENGTTYFDVEGEGHRLEQAVQVYVRRDSLNGSWIIDATATLEGSMDGCHDGNVHDEECECTDEQGHCDAKIVAEKDPLPTPLELMQLLADALGYETRPRW